MLVGTLIPAMTLVVLFGRRLAIRRAGGTTARLHVNLVFFFSLVAAVPTLLVAVFASILFQTGVAFWNSDSARGLFENANRTIWLDGRPHPPPEALHTFNGFSTGRWDGDSLVVETTHMKPGWLRRNGTPTSERAKMIEYFTRFDDYLLVTTIIDDPVYFAEPFVRTTEYLPTTRPAPVLGDPFTRNDGPIFYKCFPAEETTADQYYVPHYLPGENTLLDEFSEKYAVPRWAMAAGAATMYPDFAARLERGERGISAAPARVPPPQPSLD